MVCDYCGMAADVDLDEPSPLSAGGLVHESCRLEADEAGQRAEFEAAARAEEEAEAYAQYQAEQAERYAEEFGRGGYR